MLFPLALAATGRRAAASGSGGRLGVVRGSVGQDGPTRLLRAQRVRRPGRRRRLGPRARRPTYSGGVTYAVTLRAPTPDAVTA